MVAGKSKSRDQPHHSPTTPPLFSHSATKVAVAQICRSAGFKRFQPSALEALTTISTFYLQSLAKSAASFAAVSGRTQSNLFDIVRALEDLASPIGFSAASRPAYCVMSSAVLTDLRSFVRRTVELPFSMPMPVPVRQGDNLFTPNLALGDDCRQKLEIPPWLPAFPDVRNDEIEDRKRTELHWEENRVEKDEWKKGLLKEHGKRRSRLPLRRDKVKFRILGKRKEKVRFLLNCDDID